MTDVTHRLILSVTEPNNNVGLLVVRQDDEATQKFSVELVENGEMKTFEGLTVEFVNATRINQGMPIISKVNDVYPDQGRFEYILQSQDLQFVGQNSGYFNFKNADGKKIFSTRNFHFRVERGVYKGKIADGGYLWEITELIRLTNEWIESIKGILGDDAAASLSAAIVDHVGNKKNPHGVTKAQIDLGDVPNYAAASELEAIAGTAGNKLITPQGMNSFYLEKTQKRRQRWDEGLNWIAHRGNNTTYPENTIPAFLASGRHFGVETDIQVTSDGKWVVMHDETVDRTTNGTGKIASMTLAQFRALRIDTGANLAACTDAERTPPILEEYLLACKTINRVPVIEIKSFNYTEAHYATLKEILTRFGYDETNCVVISFDFAVLTKMRALYPNMELQYLVDSITTSTINQAISLGIPAALSSNYNQTSVNDANIKLIHAAGLKIGVWTVPDASFDKMVKLGVDYITTNSRSGNLRYSKLSLVNGFKAVTDAGKMDSNYVEEIGGGAVHVDFNVEGGVNTHDSSIAKLPAWAVPMYRQYASGTIRTENGVAMGSFDVNGRVKGTVFEAGVLGVGLNWENRTTWAAGSTVYALN